MTGLKNGRIHLDGCQIEPENFAVFKRVQSDPVDDLGFVDAQFESGDRRSAVEKVNSTNVPGTKKIKPPHAITGNAIQVIIPAFKGQADELYQLFFTPGQMLSQTQEAKAVLAKRVQPHGDGSAIGP